MTCSLERPGGLWLPNPDITAPETSQRAYAVNRTGGEFEVEVSLAARGESGQRRQQPPSITARGRAVTACQHDGMTDVCTYLVTRHSSIVTRHFFMQLQYFNLPWDYYLCE